MARKPVLTDKQWPDVLKRVPPLGIESIRSVAREIGISEGTIRKRVNTHEKPINALANQIARVEQEFDRLPINTQVKVRTLADKLKGISDNMASAAEFGAQTAHKLSMIASVQAEKIDGAATLAENTESLKSVMAIQEGANRASQIGLNLLAANKGQIPPDPNNPANKPRTRAEFYADEAGT